MPPEPSPWDRKDFFRERKHERSELLGGGGGGGASGFGGGARWREHPLNHHHYSSSRWVPDFRSRYPPGHGKQGGWHLYQEESAHGFMVSRSSEKIIEDDSGRPSGSRGEGKYSRNGRENRGSFGQRDWRCHSWETTSPNGPGRLNETNDQRLVDGVMNCQSSQPHSEYVNSRDQSHSRDQHNKSGTNGLGSTGQRVERENSLGSIEWKPLKWTRSGSLSSRGSFSHSNSSKSTGLESNETKAEMHPKNLTPIQSPSGDATACVTSSAPLEETNSRKKPRLGWGEGLAKYEKKKVEGPDDSAIKNCTVNSGNNLEANHSNPVILADKSPQVAGSSDCASPATPSSVACSSSPGLEEKQFVKATHADQDSGDIIGSPCAVSLRHPEDIVFNLEDLDLTKISKLNTKINELLQSDASSFNDNGFIRSTALNKLLVLKSDVSKIVEKTELEIDMLENELKSLNSGTENRCPAPSASSSLPKECESKPFEDQGATPNVSNRLISLGEISSFVDTNMDTIHDAHGAEDVKVKILDIDSPGSATSKLVEVPSTDKNVSASEEKNVEALVMTDVTDCRYLEVENALPSSEEENANEISTCEKTSQIIAGDHKSLSDGNLNCSGDDLYNLIFAANKESANRAAEVLNSLLPANGCSFDISRASSSLLVVDPAIKEKVIKRKKHQQSKEKILALKFKVFHHLWKEDTNMLSLRKFRAKSQRKFDLSLRPVHIGHQKHRLSSRSRPSSAVGNLNLVPSSELLNFTSRLLSDSKVKVYRSTERMPALILDKKEKMISRFISNNGLVEDPCSSEKERLTINPWTSEEREIFIDKLATFGKDFSKIASFLDHKTTADCIEFYYKNHKSDCFAKTKRKPGYTKQGKSTYLVASGGKRWNREVNAVSLDILGAASAIAANVDDEIVFQKCTSKYLLGVTSETKMPRHDELDVSNSLDVCNSDRETVAADVLAGICGSLSSEAMSSCITSSIDPSDGYHEWKYQKVSSSTRRPLTPEVTQSVDDETCSDESCGEMDPTDWTDEEKLMFIQAVSSYGKDFTMISRFVKTRSRDQCKIFFSKARKCLGLDTISPQPGNVVREDANGGGSDAEDACLLETDSSICIKESGIKVESPNMKLNQELDLAEGMDVKPDLNSSEDNGDNGTGDLDSIDTELVSNHMSPNACDMDKQEIESDRDIKDEANVVVQGAGNVISSPFQSELVVDKSGDECLPDKNCSDANAGEGDDVAKNLTEESRDHLAPLPECSLNVKSGLQLAGYDTSTIADTSSGMDDISGCHTKGDSESDSRLKSDVSSLQVSNNAPLMQSPSQDSAVIACEASNGDKLTNLDLESVGDLKHLKSSGVSEQHISEHIESLQVIGSIAKENGDFGCKISASVQGLPKADRNTQSARLKTADCVVRKCSSSPHGSCSITEQPFPNQQQTQSSSCSEVGKPSRNGDVKLFGQILTKPSSQQNSNCNTQRREETSMQHPKINNSKSFGVNDGIPGPGKFECNNFRGSENHLPVRSYGYWDGNRIQTGFSSLPDSTILLAKYPAAFGNYAMPSTTKMEQPPFHAVVKSSERNLNGVPVVYPSSNGVAAAAADFQVYRSREVQQPFGLDMKQRPEVSFSEMQRRSGGFDVVSGMQQQARGRIGINVVGRGGILVGGGQCTGGVSDPVAAIKMHYAKVEQFGGQGGGSMMREEDTWRGKGEIGR